jgi:cytochrome c
MKLKALGIAALFSAATFVASPAHAEGDAAAGKTVFKKCGFCHDIRPGKVKNGPSLHGVVGRKAGTAPGYRFSPAMQKAGLTWTDANLHKYLENPRKMVRGTRMAFAGLRSQKERDDVIAYLKTLK